MHILEQLISSVYRTNTSECYSSVIAQRKSNLGKMHILEQLICLGVRESPATLRVEIATQGHSYHSKRLLFINENMISLVYKS